MNIFVVLCSARRPEWDRVEGTGGAVEGVSPGGETDNENRMRSNFNGGILNSENKLLLLRIKSKIDCFFSVVLWSTA